MKLVLLLALAFLVWPGIVTLPAASVLRDFVTVRGDQLMAGGKPYRGPRMLTALASP